MKKHSKKRFQINEAESDWGGFLVDADALASLPFLKRASKATTHDDPDIVKEAWDNCQTIVTSNRRDFLRYIQAFQNPPIFTDCRDLWGLLVLPNSQLDREKGLRDVRHGLDVLQKERLRWPGAGLLNLYVRLTADGKAEIHRFKRCSFCENPKTGFKINDSWNEWYRSLPVIGD